MGCLDLLSFFCAVSYLPIPVPLLFISFRISSSLLLILCTLPSRPLLSPHDCSERNADSRTKAQKVLQKSEQQGRNEHTIDYDEMNPFTLDCAALKPIYKGSPSVKCSYCASTYGPAAKGQVCATCQLCTVGLETVGLVTQAAPSGRK